MNYIYFIASCIHKGMTRKEVWEILRDGFEENMISHITSESPHTLSNFYTLYLGTNKRHVAIDFDNKYVKNVEVLN